MKKSLLIYYILVNLRFFPMRFLCFLKMYHVRLFIMEKMGFGMAPRRCGICSKPQPLLQKICISYTFETLVAYIGMCLCTHAVAHVNKLQPTNTGRGPLWSFYFPK